VAARFNHKAPWIVKRAGFVDVGGDGSFDVPSIVGDSSAILNDGKRFIVHADEKLTAFVELERAIHEFAVDLISQNFTIL
jgi:hypothetical protein